jgi:hypothetical protein
VLFRIGLDPQFPPPNYFPPSKKYHISENALGHNKFELVFDELRDGHQLATLYSGNSLCTQCVIAVKNIGHVSEDKEEYADDGHLIEEVAD